MKKKYKVKFSTNQILKNKFEKKKLELTQVSMSHLRPSYETKIIS
jgi:hypothetical protein